MQQLGIRCCFEEPGLKEKLEPDPSNQVGPTYAPKVHHAHGAGERVGDIPSAPCFFRLNSYDFRPRTIREPCPQMAGVNPVTPALGLVSKPLPGHIENVS